MSAKKRVEVEIRDGEAEEQAAATNEETEERPGEDTAEATSDNHVAEDDSSAELTEEEILRQRLEEVEDRLLRTAAEFENYKKRTARQFEAMAQSANERLLVELLEVIDNFERALAHAGDQSDSSALTDGVKLIHSQLHALLEKYNVRPIEAVGQPFDPNLHEAMMQTPSKEHPEGHVAMEMSRGYRQGDRVLRYSKVAVSTGPGEDDSSDE